VQNITPKHNDAFVPSCFEFKISAVAETRLLQSQPLTTSNIHFLITVELFCSCPKRSFTTITNAQQYEVHISYNELHPNWTTDLKVLTGIVFAPKYSQAVWQCTFFLYAIHQHELNFVVTFCKALYTNIL
jgi:hypothetical protein